MTSTFTRQDWSTCNGICNLKKNVTGGPLEARLGLQKQRSRQTRVFRPRVPDFRIFKGPFGKPVFPHCCQLIRSTCMQPISYKQQVSWKNMCPPDMFYKDTASESSKDLQRTF